MDDWSRPARDDVEDWRESVDAAWERLERLNEADEHAAKDEPVDDEEGEK